MLVLVCYDVRDERRLRKVARTLEAFGARVLESVFECHLSRRQMECLRSRLLAVADPYRDRVALFAICRNDARHIIILGKGQVSRDWDFWLG